ncbi:MAG: hypothetical protein NWF01_07985 [Candidatus Bathyarchaeota archaeon]|nr:hypothetical protein [Candidatus Bathyarchaeota archaeon]
MVSVLLDFPHRKKQPPMVQCRKCGHVWQVKKKSWVKRLGALPRRCPRKNCECKRLEVIS